jgi:penicillin-binding protein 1C
MEWYYRQHHPEYKPYIPENKQDYSPMEFIYPESGAEIYIPRQLDGSTAGITFNLAHRNPDTKVFWHLDNEYAGQTQFLHQIRLIPSKGKHTVTAVDESGNSISIAFTIG